MAIIDLMVGFLYFIMQMMQAICTWKSLLTIIPITTTISQLIHLRFI